MSITMKTRHRCAKAGMRGALLSVLLLSACANFPRVLGANGAAQEDRSAEAAAAQPAPPPKPAPVEAQPPAPVPADSAPPKPRHNVEED